MLFREKTFHILLLFIILSISFLFEDQMTLTLNI